MTGVQTCALPILPNGSGLLETQNAGGGPHGHPGRRVDFGAFGVRAQSPNTIQDPLLKEPYVDVDEWRSEPVRHRYVHGGFKGTEARFSIYFPPKEQ